MGLFALIIGVIALAAIITVTVLTVKWLVNKVKEFFINRNVKKVAAIDIERLADECTNQTSLDELEKLMDKGVETVMASIDYSGQVVDIECVKSNYIDDEFEEKLGDERMIVINR